VQDLVGVKLTYNAIAGGSAERLAALSDGVFAVAMTLLVLDVRAPAVEAIHSELDLRRALIALTPRLVMYVMTFLTLGIFWVGQQTQLNHLARSDRSLTWVHLWFLLAVSMTPFSTTLLAQFTRYRSALLIYWANIALLGLTLFLSWQCAMRAKLIKPEVSQQTSEAIKRRIVIAQCWYVVGAALCAIDTYWSIGWIVTIQLFYAIAPRLPRRRKAATSALAVAIAVTLAVTFAAPVRAQEEAPISLGLVIDNSGGMRDQRKAMLDAVQTVFDLSNPPDEFFVMEFSDQVYLDQAFTSDPNKIGEALDKAEFHSFARIGSALTLALDYAKQRHKNAKTALLLITRGDDDPNRQAVNDLTRKAREDGIPIYCVGLLQGEDSGLRKEARRLLDALAKDSGGIAYYPNGSGEEDQMVHQLLRQLRGLP